jgi:hypothetical protein
MNMNGNQQSWNANAAFLQEITDQLKRTNESLSTGDLSISFECVKTLYNLSTIKTSLDTDEVFDILFKNITAELIEYNKNQGMATKTTTAVSMNYNLHLVQRKIIRLLGEKKLIKLDPDDISPQEEVKKDF